MNRPAHRVPDLPERLASLLRKDISDRYKPGDKIETIRALCRQFDVSVNSMRAALSILSREGHIEMWHGSGIYVKESKDDRVVGVLMALDFSGPDVSYFWRRATQQLRLLLAAQGLHSRLYAGFSNPATGSGTPICQEFFDDAANGRLKGVIVAHGIPQAEWMDPLKQRDVPVVGPFRAFENHVELDLPSAVRVATTRLLEAGRRKLAYLGWGRSDSRQNILFDAFAETLSKFNVPLNKRWVQGDFHPSAPGAGWAEFREIWTSSAEKPDGLLVTDDVLFRSVAIAISEFGIRVPDQLVVATHANLGAVDEFPFPVWRMITDPDVMAREQVKMLLALLQRQSDAQRQVILPVQFVESEELPPVTADSGRIT